MHQLTKELRQHITGDVRDDEISRSVYSVDASIYEIRPDLIAIPRTKQELVTAVRLAAKHQIAVIPRGAATGIAGGCIGRGLVLDTSKYLNAIIALDHVQCTARIQPGVVQSALNVAAAPYKLRLGPDTSTGNRATVGGMLANNSAGARSLRYGKMVDHIQEVELLLANGDLIQCRDLTEDEVKAKCALDSREGEIYREVVAIRAEYADDIRAHMPQLPRRASGFNLDTLLKGPLNLSRLIAGSEGSLGIITELCVGLVPMPGVTGLCLIQLSSLEEAFAWIPKILEWQPLALELIDDKIVAAGRSSPSLATRTSWISGTPKAVLVVEFDAAAAAEVQQRCEDFIAYAEGQAMGYAASVVTDHSAMNDVWAVRESGLGLLLSKRSYNRAFAFLEDVTVAPAQLGDFMKEFLQLLRANGKDAGVYGHVGAGCMHVRPYVDLRDPQEVVLMETLMRETTQLLIRHKGALSGEHGDGLVRSWLNEMLFGPRLYEAFCRLKRAFDPEGRMNPGKVVAIQPLGDNLRSATKGDPEPFTTYLDFSREGGIELAADLCNGNGLCRKREGLMCPSFQAFGDEFHSTRARAQSFRDLFHGQLKPDALVSHEMYHVLEYCLECKGCKTECPSQVDMAKMKAEFLYHYQNKHGVTLRSWLFGHMPALYRWMSPIASLFNRGADSALAKWLLQKVGITTKRTLPPLAPERFSTWFARCGQKLQKGHRQIVFFNDTYTEYINPKIGKATTILLNALGYEVICPPLGCCGRPLISKGLLPQAKRKAEDLVNQLKGYIESGVPIVGVEPSCVSALVDDYRDLIGADLKASVMSIEEFLAQRVSDHQFHLSFSKDAPQVHVWVHTHCHQKALAGTRAMQTALAAIPGVTVHEIGSGCCGLAGSFGYEAEHYDFSMAIGEKTLLPDVRQIGIDDVIIANGLSCRSQIKHGAARQALHLAEFIVSRLQA